MSSASNVYIRFSADDDAALIDHVSEFDILWKMGHPDFKNNLKKDKIWKYIGQQLNKTGDSCKKRWRSIRDHFMRERKDATASGKAAKRKKRAPYWESLSFLNILEDERKSFTNAGVAEIVEAAMESDDSAAGEINVEIVDVADIVKVENLSDCGKDGERGESESEDFHGIDQLPSTWQAKMKPGRDARMDDDKQLMTNQLQRVYDETNQLDQCVERILNEKCRKENENDLFFKSMAAIVNKLDNKSQAIARSQVFRIVSDLELAQFK